MKAGRAIDNINISVKMVALALMAVVAVSVPVFFLIQAQNQHISSTTMELKGMMAAKSLQQLLRHLQDHRGSSAGVLSGNLQLTSQVSSAARDANNALQIAREKMAALDDDNLLNRLETIGNNLDALTRNVASRSVSVDQSFLLHTEMIDSVRELIWGAGVTSGFWYESDPYIYHLMNATMGPLLLAIESMGQARALGNVALLNNEATLNQRLAINANVAKAREALAGMRRHVEAASAESGDIGKISALMNSVTDDANRILELAEQEVILKSELNYPANEYYTQFSQALTELRSFNEEALNTLESFMNERVASLSVQRNISLAAISVLVLVGGLLGWAIVRSISTSIHALVRANESMAAGQYTLALDVDRQDEIGTLNRAMQHLSGQLREATVQATENSRIRAALDSASVNVMISDSERNIIYMNEAVQSMLRTAESDIREVLPQFHASKILGGSMDMFHKNPAHQASLLAGLSSSHQAQIKVGKRHFRLLANPIMDAKGQRLGSVVEWLDRTEEVKTEQEISELVQAASQGDFKKRAETAGKAGFWLTIANSLNNVMETADKGLSDVARVLTALANGDLTQRIDAEYQGTFDELKLAANTTSNNLTQMISEIREAVETIHTASTEIASGNADLSSRTEQQAASLEETASSMEELTGTVRLNADNAKQANSLASQASDVAVDGGEVIGKVVATMGAINDSAQKIADIIGVIDGIAFQTNILALNAAVEAARAGDQGRGFAVVASEVRALAQRSANAAKDIKALISDSVQKISDGNSLVNRSGETMKAVVTSIKRVNDIMEEIAAASSEQASGIDEIGKAVAQMDEMTQQNAALVEEAAAAAESLQSQADQLSSRVATFRLDSRHLMHTRNVQERHVSSERSAIPAVRSSSRPAAGLARAAARPLVKPAKNEQEDEWEDF